MAQSDAHSAGASWARLSHALGNEIGALMFGFGKEKLDPSVLGELIFKAHFMEFWNDPFENIPTEFNINIDKEKYFKIISALFLFSLYVCITMLKQSSGKSLSAEAATKVLDSVGRLQYSAFILMYEEQGFDTYSNEVNEILRQLIAARAENINSEPNSIWYASKILLANIDEELSIDPSLISLFTDLTKELNKINSKLLGEAVVNYKIN